LQLGHSARQPWPKKVNLPTCDVTHEKPETQNFKKILIANYKTRQVFEGLNSSLAQLTGELWNCKDLANMGKLYLLKQNTASSKGVKKHN